MEINSTPLISIIVPVYNTERFLRECLDSIVNQTYRNLEIILVDDGSTDGSPGICDEYAGRDERVRVIHQENRGQGAARNAALDCIHGDYVAFIDSDDTVELNYMEVVAGLVCDKDLCGVMIEGLYMSEAGEIAGNFLHIFDEYAELPVEAVTRMMVSCEVPSYAWECVYRRDCWQSVRFPTGRLYEDHAALFRAMSCGTGSVAFTQDRMYRYRRHEDSSTSQCQSCKRAVYDCFLANREHYDYAVAHYDEDVVRKCLDETVPLASDVMTIYRMNTAEYAEAKRFLGNRYVKPKHATLMRVKYAFKDKYPRFASKIVRIYHKVRKRASSYI